MVHSGVREATWKGASVPDGEASLGGRDPVFPSSELPVPSKPGDLRITLGYHSPRLTPTSTIKARDSPPGNVVCCRRGGGIPSSRSSQFLIPCSPLRRI